MPHESSARRVRAHARGVRALARASLVSVCASAALLFASSHASAAHVKAFAAHVHAFDAHGRGGDSEPSSFESAQRQLVVRLRSFVPGASGRVVIEPSEEGGRVRLTASRLPAPESVAAGARVYVVWATGGEVRRVGLLRRDAHGDASFEFAHPTGLASYSLVVTAERDAGAARPAGAFVFSTRAGEVSAFYPPKPEPRSSSKESVSDARRESRGAGAGESQRVGAGGTAIRSRTVTTTRESGTTTARTPSTPTGVRAVSSPAISSPAITRTPSAANARASSDAASEFYESIDSAVEDPAAARTLTLEGVGKARRATGEARVATRAGTAYVRVRFRNVPPPARYGVRKYVMWAQLPEDGPLFLRALPARRLNRRAIYARRGDVGSDRFGLSVTAERRYPRARPRGRRVLATRGAADARD